MVWQIDFHKDFALEFKEYEDTIRLEIMAIVELLREEGPSLGRPHVDTLQGSRHANMKELRCRGACKTWRVAFAFTPERVALLLAAGDKSQMKSKRFYRWLVTTAEKRLDQFLKEAMKKEATSDESA